MQFFMGRCLVAMLGGNGNQYSVICMDYVARYGELEVSKTSISYRKIF